MRIINNAEIAKRLLLNEKIASKFTFNEILDIVDSCRTLDEEFLKCDADEVVKAFEQGFLERIEWEEYEKQPE